MHKLYLKNENKEYYYGQPIYDKGLAILLALELKKFVPFIMITNENDHSIFEAENGDVVFPDDVNFDDFPSMNYTDDLFAHNCTDIDYLLEIRNQLSHTDKDFYHIEAALLASAIFHEINLPSLGWQRP